ncbi:MULTISPECIES: dihydroxyacetone kinase subunit DhaL [unclassified Bacillus (in: firmicutes)]|uniref:dihydroxyacetone kinase subunit DhaL n=1 Tax=unclassified Bacillus (in: firmicutes) TaxID=185979 RepID=UPI000E3EB9AC|nr:MULTISPECIES: dihydroxyacetone kinase subunit DhaL [unclassified Bacillus (in: firmicutes)]RFU69765.1 dihydroxyacetone kinase subunit L [Bacillus sp. V59.32b]CAH0346859.1 PTS-dependent dihydroxyacetone kinase, ADP-binding subunit DhaL [Bacillus sp. CECT 9360]
MGLTAEHMKMWLEKTNDYIQTNRDYLTDLDQAIGDGDHGINMSRGFNEAVRTISSNQYKTASDLLKEWGMTLLSKVGGASGPLFGSALLKMSIAIKDREEVDYASLRAAIEEGLNGILLRGKAEEHQKTMVDVWYPVVRLLKENESFNPQTFRETAKTSMEDTKDTQAIKGRAAYLNERSIGHIDPGSASSYYLFRALAEVVEEGRISL